jgi:subtilisin family serine protease
VALLAACNAAPSSPGAVQAQATTATIKDAETSGRIGAWASGRIGAWASGQVASTLPDGTPNTFQENLPDWATIHLAQAQALAPNLGKGVVVAIVDTGIDLAHPAFQGHLSAPDTWRDVVNRDADPSEVPTTGNADYGHGTAVAGVILQIAPGARIMPIRAMTADGSGLVSDLAAGVDWAVVHGAQVINLSAVSSVDSVLSDAIIRATSAGVYVTMAAGNDGVNRVSYPARRSVQTGSLGQYALNAGAVNTNLTLASWSNYGNLLELSAPGVDIATALPGGGYGLASGTSFSTPVLSGTLALALGQPYNTAYQGQLAQQMDSTGTDLTPYNSGLLQGETNPLGSGLLDAAAFLRSIR